MTDKNIRRCISAFVCAVLFVCTAVVCNAAGSKIQIEKLDNMSIQLPDNMLGITRDSKSTDKYFSVFGLDYDKTMSDFKSSDIFMQAMDNRAATTVTVTMTRNGDSEGIKNYNRLSDEKLYEVRKSFISQGEYISCTPDQVQDIVWLMFDLNVTSPNGRIKAFQANTVYDGMSINVTIQRNGGNVTPADYQTLQAVLSTVTFDSKAAPDSDFTVYVYIGITALVIILFIILMIAGKKTKKKNSKTRNDKILRELTDKYRSDKKPARKTQGEGIMSIYKAYDEMNESDNNASNRKNDDLFDDFTDIDEEEVKVRIYEKPTVSDAEIDAIVNESKARFRNDDAEVEVIGADTEKPGQVISDGNEDSDLQSEQADDKQTSAAEEYENSDGKENSDTSYEDEETVPDENEAYEEDEPLEETEEEDEEELRREAERNTADDFDEGYDFFEEKPRRIVGIIDVDSSDLKNAVDYDVLSEEEKRAVEVETADDNDKTESFIDAASKAGAGIKNFFVHCGYFCTNVSRLIKRKYAAKKRRKAELERRERERIRRQQTDARRDKNGLVKVHSAFQRGPKPQGRAPQPGNQSMRKAPSRRPQQNGNNRRK